MDLLVFLWKPAVHCWDLSGFFPWAMKICRWKLRELMVNCLPSQKHLLLCSLTSGLYPPPVISSNQLPNRWEVSADWRGPFEFVTPLHNPTTICWLWMFPENKTSTQTNWFCLLTWSCCFCANVQYLWVPSLHSYSPLCSYFFCGLSILPPFYFFSLICFHIHNLWLWKKNHTTQVKGDWLVDVECVEIWKCKIKRSCGQSLLLYLALKGSDVSWEFSSAPKRPTPRVENCKTVKTLKWKNKLAQHSFFVFLSPQLFIN